MARLGFCTQHQFKRENSAIYRDWSPGCQSQGQESTLDTPTGRLYSPSLTHNQQSFFTTDKLEYNHDVGVDDDEQLERTEN